jgi:hypothetical protein
VEEVKNVRQRRISLWRKKIFYTILFDDERFAGFSSVDFETMIEAFYK